MGHLWLSPLVVLAALACAITAHGFLESPDTDVEDSLGNVGDLDQCALCQTTMEVAVDLLKIRKNVVFKQSCKSMKKTADYQPCLKMARDVLKKLTSQPRIEMCKHLQACAATQVEDSYDMSI
ncbi:uncharacterized protein LOC116939356 [Petromyzon marinus]|uniref:Uncharacterized protein LOC116939356 n=1 Tax=Petromyzon marinus TaxID=7757 RepID=A0AAJ7SQ54_PETMA|nr:uncharacterized protein LOC116939356 [Petromyzon marinus]